MFAFKQKNTNSSFSIQTKVDICKQYLDQCYSDQSEKIIQSHKNACNILDNLLINIKKNLPLSIQNTKISTIIEESSFNNEFSDIIKEFSLGVSIVSNIKNFTEAEKSPNTSKKRKELGKSSSSKQLIKKDVLTSSNTNSDLKRFWVP